MYHDEQRIEEAATRYTHTCTCIYMYAYIYMYMYNIHIHVYVYRYMSPRVVLYIPCIPQESWVNLVVAQATTNIADGAQYTRDTPYNVSSMRNAHRGHGYSKYTTWGTFILWLPRLQIIAT